MRRAARVDANHAAIVAALRRIGCEVLDLSAVGAGCPDLLVLHRGKLQLIEVKDGAKRPSARRLTADQVRFALHWPVKVVRSVEDAIGALS